MSHGGGTKAIVAALAANIGIAVTKFLAFLLTASSAMLAESIHSVADSGNQLLLLIGGKRARREATPDHPFGFGRERYIYAFIVSIILFSLGGVFALYEGYHKLHDPHPITEWQWVPIVVLVAALIMEGLSFRTATRESNPLRRGATWYQFIRRSREPELPVVLLEDSAALVGLILALAGVSLTLVTHDGVFDGIATVLIGVLLVVVAAVLAIETKSLLIGESATLEHVQRIEAALVDGERIERIIHMKTLHLGPDELLVGAKVGVPAGATAQDIATAIDEAEVRIRAAVPIARVIYIEPDIFRGARA